MFCNCPLIGCHPLTLLLFRANPLSEFNCGLLSSELGRQSFCVTPQESQDQMTESSELSRDEFIKGSKELAMATSFSLKCHRVGGLGKAPGPLWLMSWTQETGQELASGFPVLLMLSLGRTSRNRRLPSLRPACGIVGNPRCMYSHGRVRTGRFLQG